MEPSNAKSVLVATLLVVPLSVALFVSTMNSNDTGDPSAPPSISSLSIYGNSTDILYGELDRADFRAVGQEWVVSVQFLNDSDTSVSPESSECNFTISQENLHVLVGPLFQGIDSANTSDADAMTVLETSPSYAWQIEISFTDGSWVYLTIWLTVPYVFLLEGTGTPNHNLLDAVVLEPVSTFDPLAAAINQMFVENLG